MTLLTETPRAGLAAAKRRALADLVRQAQQYRPLARRGDGTVAACLATQHFREL